MPAHLVEFFNTGSQQAAWHRLTDAAWVATYRATTSDTVTTVPQLSGDSREAFRRVSRKCRIRHPHAIGREIPPRGVRPYKTLQGVLSARRHVHKAAVMALERDRHGGRGPVAMLGDDEIRLARPR
jgi:hypothetical protein